MVCYICGGYFILQRITYDNSIERWLPANSEAIENYKLFLEDFDSDALLIIAFQNQDATYFQNTILPKIKSIKDLDHVINVSSWPVKYIQHKKTKQPIENVFFIKFEPKSHVDPNRPELIDQIKKLFSAIKGDYHLVGTGVIHQAINEQTQNQASLYFFIGLVVLTLLLVVVLKSFIAIVQTLLVALASVVTMMYTSVIFGIPISMALTILPVILLFYSTSISMHVLSHRGDFKKVLRPSIWVVATTVLGFASFLFSDITLLKDFAILGIAGVMGVFLAALWIFYPESHRFELTNSFKVSKKTRLIPFRILRIILISVILLTIPGLFLLKSEIYSLSVLTKKNRAYIDHTFVESVVGPYFPLEYTVDETHIERTLVSRWIHDVYELHQIGAVISYNRFPPLLDKTSLGYQSKSDQNIYRITFFVPLMSTSQGVKLIEEINGISEKHFGIYQPKLTGFMTLYTQVSSKLLSAFRNSLGLAFSFVFIVFFLFLKKLKLVLLAMLVNILPIITMLSLMGWFGIRLDMVTIPIGCMLLSMVVDDTIHFMYWYTKRGDLQGAILKSGPGIILTSAVICSGFVVLMFSSAPPIRYFGFLSVYAVFAALICDMVILPSLIQKFIGDEKNRK
jgi:predicted RND superfamily exporter protein